MLRHSVRGWILVAATLALFVGESSLAMAQAPRHGQAAVVRPRRPTISPYLNIARDQSGALPSYQAFVVPRLEQQQQQQVQRWIQSRTQKLEDLSLEDPTLRATGTGGSFQNFTHFYPPRRTK